MYFGRLKSLFILSRIYSFGVHVTHNNSNSVESFHLLTLLDKDYTTMNTEIWKVFGQVAGIGGLALGVFLVLFRNVIQKIIFSNLDPSQSYKIIKLILILVWSITFLGLSVYAIKFNDDKVIENVTLIGKVVNTEDQPVAGARITVEGDDFFQDTRPTGLFQGRLGHKVTQGGYLIVSISHKGYLQESLNVQINDSTVNLHTIILRKKI